MINMIGTIAWSGFLR